MVIYRGNLLSNVILLMRILVLFEVECLWYLKNEGVLYSWEDFIGYCVGVWFMLFLFKEKIYIMVFFWVFYLRFCMFGLWGWVVLLILCDGFLYYLNNV